MLKSTHAVPAGVFKGSNFMTPKWLGYFMVRGGWAELSQGRGMEGEPIFGVTVRDSNGRDLEPKASRLCFSRREATAYLEEISE